MATTFSGIIESFIKPEALAEFDKLGSKLDASLEGFDKMIAKAALLSTEISKGGQAYSQYIAQTKQIADANNQLQNSQGSITANLKSYNTLLKETADNIKQNTGATDDQARRLIALRTEYSKVKDAVATYQKLIREVGKENPAQLSEKTFNEVFNTFGTDTANSIKDAFNSLDSATKGDFIAKLTADAGAFFEIQKQLEQEIKAVGSAINFQAKEAAAADGSITQLGARLEGLQKAYFGLSEADRNNPVGQNLKKQIDELDPIVKGLEKGIGVTKRLVGDYAGQLSPAFQVLNDRLKENNKLIDENTTFTQLGAEAQHELLLETAALDKLLKSNAVTLGDLKGQNIALQKTLIGLEQANLKGSESYKIIQAELVKGTKAVNDLRGEVKALSSDSRSLDQAVGVATALVNIYQTGAGVMELFGKKSEDSQKAIARLVAVQSVLNGLQGIQQQLTQRGTVLNRLYTYAQAQMAIATDATAASTVRLRAALITTGIGAAVVLIGYLVSKMLELKDSVDVTTESLETFEKRLDSVKNTSERSVDIIDRNTRVNVAKLKASGASENEIFTETQEGRKEHLAETEKLWTKYATSQNSLYQTLTTNERVILNKILANENVAEDKITNNIKKFIEVNSRLQVVTKEINNSETDLAVASLENQGKLLDKRKELTKKEIDAQLELFKLRKDQQIKDAQEVIAFNPNDVQLQISLRENIAQQEINVLNATVAAKLAKNNLLKENERFTATEILVIKQDAANKEREINEKLTRDIYDLYAKSAARIKEINDGDAAIDNLFFDENSAERQIAALVATFEKRRSVIQTNESNQLAAIESARAAGLISEKDYQYRRAEIEEETALAILQTELDLAKKKLLILKQSGVDTIAAEEEIARLEKDIAARKLSQGSDNTKNGGKSPLKKSKEEVDELRNAWYNLGQTLSDSVFAVLTRGFEQAKNDLQDQIDLIEEKKAKEIEAVNASGAATQDKADRIKIIEATADAQRKELERRQRQADMEKARFDRTAQAVSIIGNTARGVTAALPNIPLSIIVGAIGALQLATLYATPLPKYLHGKKAGQGGGLATVSEDGRPELYIDPNTGTMGLTPAKPSLMYVSKASTIIPAGQVNDFLQYSGIGHVPQFTGNSSNSAGGTSFTDMNIVNAIKNKKMIMSVNIVNNTGFYDHIKKRIFE